jgi:dolichyl-phosphate beta-glucosyltransferase
MKLSGSRPYLTYSLAVHNSAPFIEEHVERLVDRLRQFSSAEIVLVENGSRDNSLELARHLAARFSSPTLDVRVDQVAKGLGNAHRRGLALSRGEHVVVVGVDLPFGFSDLDQWVQMESPPSLVLGSKSHRLSRHTVSVSRRAFSLGFRAARWALLDIDPGDSQGSIIIDGDLARRVQPYLVCADYLVTTEIVAWAMHFGAQPREIPVDYPDIGASTVSPVRDGLRMLRGMVAMRSRLRREGRVLAPASHVTPPS